MRSSLSIVFISVFLFLSLFSVSVSVQAQENQTFQDYPSREFQDYDIEGSEGVFNMIDWLFSAEGIYFIFLVFFSCLAGAYGGMLVGGVVICLFLMIGAAMGLIPSYVVVAMIFVAAGFIAYAIVKFTGGGGGEE